MKKRTKIFLSLIGVFLSFVLVTQKSFAEEVMAEDSKLEVVIHRLIVKSADMIIQNEGKPIDVNKLKELRGLNGVTFSIYEITDRLDSLLQKGMTLEEAQLQLIRSTYSLQNLAPLRTVVTVVDNGEDGIAKVSLPTIMDKKQAFLIIETSSTIKEAVKSDQIVLVTPIYDQYGEQMDTIHIYPKNIMEEIPKKKENPESKKLPNTGEEIRSKLPSTGEIIQSKLSLAGLLVLVIGGLSYYFVNKNRGSEKSNSLD